MDYHNPILDGAKIVIADDSVTTLHLLGQILSKQGYYVQPVMTGQAILAMVDTPPDLLLLDIHLPDMPGYDVCHRLKRTQLWADVPVLFMTGDQNAHETARWFEAGGCDILRKPLYPADVVARVTTHLRYQHLVNQHAQHAEQLERTQDGQERREERDFLRRVFDQLPDCVSVKDIDGRFVLNNTAAVIQLKAQHPTELYGKNEFNLLPASLAISLVAGEADLLNEQSEQFAKETLIIDATPQWLALTKVPLRDDAGEICGLISVQRDVTAQKYAEKDLQRDNVQLAHQIEELSTVNYLARTLATMTDLFQVLKLVARSVYHTFKASEVLVALFDRTTTRVMTAVTGQNPPRQLNINLLLTQSPTLINLLTIRHPQLIETPLAATDALSELFEPSATLALSPLWARGRINGFIGLTRQPMNNRFRTSELSLLEMMTSQVGAAIEMIRLFEETKQAQKSAEAISLGKSRFLAYISHELRAPLNGILGYAQILRQDPLISARHRAGLNTIQKSGEHLLSLITDALDLARIEAGRIALVQNEFTLSAFVTNTTELVRSRLAVKRLAFQIETDWSRLPKVVQGDEKRLRQILLNLLDNAIKFTEIGEVGLTIRALDLSEAQQEAAPEQTRLRFEVRDTGVGIAPELMERIFEPFRQAENNTATNFGSGLGLSICQQLTRAMGGQLQVSSQVDAGTTFWFDIPLTVVNQPTSPLLQPTYPAPATVVGYQRLDDPETLVPYQILVTDDDPTNRVLLADLLGPLGFVVREADNGHTAWHSIQQNPPDLLLTDLVMPMLNGRELIEKVRRQPEFQHVVIFVMSASEYIHEIAAELPQWSDLFFHKPLDFGLLLYQLEQYLPLRWLYRSDEPTPPTTDLLLPADDVLSRLLHLAKTGDIRAMYDLLASLRDNYGPFVAQIEPLTEQFNLTEIRQVLERWLLEDD